MKKIGIITIHDIYNYGSILQAYATQKVIEDLGYVVEIIDYKYPNSSHLTRRNIYEFLKFKTFKVTNSLLKDILLGMKYQSYKHNYKIFKEKYYRLSEKSYPSVESLMNNPPLYDVYISGSDQIWRPQFVKDDPCFFLDFVKSPKKIAYASSFGCTSIPSDFKEKYKLYLNEYFKIGVREETGVKIIKELLNRDAHLVLDPTLLLSKENWFKVMKPYSNKRPYILCYGLESNDMYMEKLAIHIKKSYNFDIIRINGKFYDYFNRDMKYILDAGPAEWLGLFANAEIILGQSFHATAFAINFNKPFISVLRGNKDNDSRQLNLLKLVGLSNNTITIGDRFPENFNTYFNIDFSSINCILEKERKLSIKFIHDSITM